MRKPRISIFLILTVAFAAFTLGLLLGRNQHHDVISVNLPQSLLTEPTQAPETVTSPTKETEEISYPIDINLAGKEEWMSLPGIGEVLAERILNYRKENGAFTTVEELLHVEGIGKGRLEEILDLITIGG